jgi:hypothetical protein
VNDEPSLPTPKCEAKDAHPAVPAVLAASMAAIVAVCLVCGWLFVGRTVNPGSGAGGADSLFQHGPQERTDMERAWETVDPKAGTVPDGYAWVDRDAGIVQVPIDRAIDLVCAEQKPPSVAPKPGHSP